MKKKNIKQILSALVLALTLTNTAPVYAYSDSKLANIEEDVEETICKELNTIDKLDEDDLAASYERGRRIQKLISKMPYELYYDLVDKINTYDTLKSVMKDFIDKDMYDAAKEAIVYANIAQTKQAILDNFMVFCDSRNNSPSYEETSENGYLLNNLKVLDNRFGSLGIGNSLYMLDSCSQYGNYRVYDYISSSRNTIELYYFITDLEDNVIAIVSSIDNKNDYKYVKDRGVRLSSLESVLKENNLDVEIKDAYTYEEKNGLTFKISEALGDESLANNNIKSEDLYIIKVDEKRPNWYSAYDDQAEDLYFITYACPYQFNDGLHVFKDLYNPDALITADENGTYGFNYRNDVTEVRMELYPSYEEGVENEFGNIININDYLNSVGLSDLVKDEYTMDDIDVIRNIKVTKVAKQSAYILKKADK